MLALRPAAERDTSGLRARLVRDGYLYLPGLLDPATVAAVRQQVCAGLATVGWLPGGDHPPGGDRSPGGDHPPGGDQADRELVCPAGMRFDQNSFRSIYPAVQRIEDLHRLGHTPALTSLMRGLLGTDVFCHPAKAARLVAPTPPEQPYATRAHQDFVVQRVSADVLTAWVALTPCDARRPGLCLIPGSHLAGFQPVDAATGGSRPIYLPVAPDDPRWASARYAPGDVVVFHSLTVHGAQANRSDRFRLSVDLRYQPSTDPMRAEFAHPHGWPTTPDWPQLWGGWASRHWVSLPSDLELVDGPALTDRDASAGAVPVPRSRLLGRPDLLDQPERREESRR
ncbi:phytanoyl-CoA dioxygenase family protein [Solwaraspora sp. WMMD406]|uniref:phytanoyl-CoA dioxygenase family protein n=1 Tax=Solwaraspora sp. WMMD406 TaxID=3016095 RepID=UPI00241798A9|nr:phytanoyl-CoA dioxygenase family protein [Solwaraspora sp. WMMD406]MDG4765248.1 phytanoyl-CoA dioxygenase family protein [Solwaraspora sp. WMMD406]